MTTPQASLSLRTGQLLHPASHAASRRRTGASLPGTLASPRTGLPPAGCPELVERLRHDDLLVIAAPALLGAQKRSVLVTLHAEPFGPHRSGPARAAHRRVLYPAIVDTGRPPATGPTR